MFAVEVTDLEKRFRRRRGGRRDTIAALADLSFTIDHRECVAILGQNGSGKSTLVRALSTLLLPDGGSARVFGHDVVHDAGAVRRLVNRVSVEASFFKRMSAVENLSYAARFYGLTPAVTRGADPRDPRAGRLSRVPLDRADGGPQPRHAAEGGARAGAADLAGSAAARRAHHRTGPAFQARGPVVHRRTCGRRTTRRSCSAPTTSPRPRRWPSGSGSCTRADCSRSSRRKSWLRATRRGRWRTRSSPPPASHWRKTRRYRA